MKFVAFLLAFGLGFIPCWFVFGIILMLTRAGGTELGAIFFFIFMYIAVLITKKVYKIFLKKFGYEIVEDKKEE